MFCLVSTQEQVNTAFREKEKIREHTILLEAFLQKKNIKLLSKEEYKYLSRKWLLDFAALGAYFCEEKAIWANKDNYPVMYLRCLLHETVHALLKHNPSFDSKRYASNEITAETTSGLVMDKLGYLGMYFSKSYIDCYSSAFSVTNQIEDLICWNEIENTARELLQDCFKLDTF